MVRPAGVTHGDDVCVNCIDDDFSDMFNRAVTALRETQTLEPAKLERATTGANDEKKSIVECGVVGSEGDKKWCGSRRP